MRGHRHLARAVRVAGVDRIQVAQAVSELAQRHPLQQRRSRTCTHRHRSVHTCRCRCVGGIRIAADRCGGRGRIDRRTGHRHRRLRPAQGRLSGHPCRHGGGGSAGLCIAQVQLPGHRATGLGQRHAALPRRADRSRRIAALSGQLPRPRRFPRTMRGAHFQDLLVRCAPQWLVVEARYTRRGGLDINPVRTSPQMPTPLSIFRDLRQ